MQFKQTSLILLVGVAAVARADHAPFLVPYLMTDQPNGNPDGQEDYYGIQFNVSSTNGGSKNTGVCGVGWGDNGLPGDCGNHCQPYSVYVPSGVWMDCDTEPFNEVPSQFQLMLFPYFSIGNFSIQLRQNYTKSGQDNVIATSSVYHISNVTLPETTFNCTIYPYETEYEQHASGYCETPDASPGFTIPVAKTAPACKHAKSVQLSFPVTEMTVPGEYVYAVGNISALGNWNPHKGVKLSARDYTAQNTLWDGGNVNVTAGTPFEYKYVQIGPRGRVTWECGENRVFTVSKYTCGTEIVGNNPDYFRCGNH